MTQRILELIEINKQFGDGEARVNALIDASLNVEQGELVALIGPSGSGKSTLLSIAGALLSPTSGQVMLDGQDITQWSDKARTQLRLEKIGFIFQGSNLVSYLTGREQLLFIGHLIGLSDDDAKTRADRLLNDLGMKDRASHYPSELSGGERQRIGIGRALMNDPRIILADEPTASLDSTRGRRVVEMLAEEVHERSKGGILVTHDERLIDLCDRVIRIADGRLSASENPASAETVSVT